MFDARVYASLAAPNLSGEKVEALVADARMFNARVGVTGVLLFDGVWFLQYFEGAAESVESVWERIVASSSHSKLTTLATGTLPARHFAEWAVCQLPVDSYRLARLIMSDWSSFACEGLQESDVDSTAMDRLIEIAGECRFRRPHRSRWLF